jgi:hypothetical protein
MSDQTMYAPQTVHYQNQQFLVAIEGDTLTLCVVNADKSIKRLPVAATIKAAKPYTGTRKSLIDRGLLFQPLFCAEVDGQELDININSQRASEEQDEKKWLKNKVANWLLDSGLNRLFPRNVHKQYAQ